MAATREELAFENLPNFRQAGGRYELTNKNGQKIKDGLLYRSSRTDFITLKDRSLLVKLGVKSILDLRRQSEYERADGEKCLDELYPVWILKDGETKPIRPSLRWGGSKKPSHEDPVGQRVLVNMVTMKLIWFYFVQINFFIRWSTLILVAIDWLTGLHLFVKFFNWYLINQKTVPQQYIDLIENTRSVIIDILRFMTHQDSLPLLIHCAHGKDRTGVIVAIVLSLLDVDKSIILDDYELSEEGLIPIKDRVYQEIVERYGFKLECTYAKRNTMELILKHIEEKYGSVSEYLLEGGFTLQEQQKLRNLFIEEDN